MCKVEVAGLKWLARDKPDVEFVDITSLDYEPALYSGVTYEQAMREMHVVGPQGQVCFIGVHFYHSAQSSTSTVLVKRIVFYLEHPYIVLFFLINPVICELVARKAL